MGTMPSSSCMIFSTEVTLPILSHAKPSRRLFLAGCIAVYLAFVLWYTLLRRRAGYYPPQFGLFWSYRRWFQGERDLMPAILGNIAMFVPFGLLSDQLNGQTLQKKGLLLFILSALLCSALIETLQYVLLRGSFEFDDLFNNVAGALLGMGLARLARRFLPERVYDALTLFADAAIVLCCGVLFLFAGKSDSGSMRPLSQGLCFQVEDSSREKDRLGLSGVCFWYHSGPRDFTLTLRSTRTGTHLPLQTSCRLPRPEVSSYFGSDDPSTGFCASGKGLHPDEEYELVLDFGFLRSVSTGVYVTLDSAAPSSGLRRQPGARVHCVSDNEFLPPIAGHTDLDRIVTDGVLKMYSPEAHIYVYALDESLFWIAEDGFLFENDGTTRLELLLWTTQTDKLSPKALALGRDYDTLGVTFEKNELSGDLGPYRVCAFPLPASYPVTSIKTGQYSKGWIWQETFWPEFDFVR